MNWVDLIIIIVFIVYVWDGYRRGFLRLTWELVGLVLAFFFALRFYLPISNLLKSNFSWTELYTKPFSFLGIWFLTQLIFYIVGQILSKNTPAPIKDSKINHYSGLIPAAIKGIIFIAVLLILFLVIPMEVKLKTAINSSYFGSKFITATAKVEGEIQKVFAGGTDSLTSLTYQPLDQASTLNFSTKNGKIDEAAEIKMLALVNSERTKAGLSELKSDNLIRNVARMQSRDMLIRGYFSHSTPSGQNLADRLNLAHVKFKAAAENLALAPTVDLAHLGLMNSPKHRENILDPTFTRVGIGILDGGSYGYMVTQNFVR